VCQSKHLHPIVVVASYCSMQVIDDHFGGDDLSVPDMLEEGEARDLSLWDSIGDWFTGCPAGNAGDDCSVGCPCSGSNTCEAWHHVCRAPGQAGDSCHLTKPCGSHLSCEAGSHVCRHPGNLGDPCHLTRPCSSSLNCEAGAHVCRAPGREGDPCHLTRPCGGGFKCTDAITSFDYQMCLPECTPVDDATEARIKSHGYISGASGSMDAKWTGGVVPYIVHCDMANHELAKLSTAMMEIREKTNIDFKLRTASDDNYVIVSDFEENEFFSQGIGRLEDPGWQTINIDSGYIQVVFGGGLTKGIAIHELMHALGWPHTQSRPDRDSYVTIETDNIESGQESQFAERTTAVWEAVQKCRPYPYDSVMHYRDGAFSKNGENTITTTDPTKQDTIGNRGGLSSQDIQEIQEFYFGTWCDGQSQINNVIVDTIGDIFAMFNFGSFSK
jgi:hypothetical protein